MIKFHTIRWKNLLSTGNTFTEIQLDRSTNTLIVGTNGSGKSTILDALCFSLFGKPFRKINKPNLLNSINNSDGVVETEFSIGSKKYKVIRGIKPNIFEIYCNGVLLNQDAKARDYQEFLEKSILKFNFKSFTQIVILGSASFVPFMQLSAGDRRNIIEDLLDIQIFSSMNNVIKEKTSILRDNISKSASDIGLVESKIEMQEENIKDHKRQNTTMIDSLQKQIDENRENIITDTDKNTNLQKEIAELQLLIGDKQTIETKVRKLSQIQGKIESNIEKVNNEIEFYDHNDNCPTCRQILAGEFKEKQICEINQKKQKFESGIKEVLEETSKLTERLNEISTINSKISKLNNEVIKHNSNISAYNRAIATAERQIKELSQEKGNINDQMEKLEIFKKDLEVLNKTHAELINERHYYDYASSLLKDNGIKTKIIKQYLPIINKSVNKYLTAMGFFVNFSLNENFEETIKSRHRDEFSYANFSEGEKQKIDLALLFTWRHIARLKNSTNTNLLILDEVFDSSLDGEATELLMNVLNEMNTDTNIFVISHKGDQLFDKFRSIIKMEKKNNFSQVTK